MVKFGISSSNVDPTLTGWWLTYPSEKYDFVTWDDDIPNIWKKNVPNHQPVDNLNIKWFKHLNIERSWGNFMNMTSKSWDITPVTGTEGLCKQGLFCTTRLCDTSKLTLEWLAQSTDIHSPLSAPDSLRSAMDCAWHMASCLTGGLRVPLRMFLNTNCPMSSTSTCCMDWKTRAESAPPTTSQRYLQSSGATSLPSYMGWMVVICGHPSDIGNPYNRFLLNP